MSYLFNPSPNPTFNNAGQFASGALAYFYDSSTTTPLVVYQNSALTVPHEIPVVANIVGVFPPIYIPYGTYTVRITDADGAVLYYAAGIDNPAPPSSGGGIVVTQSQIFQTGWPIMLFRTGQLDGFVRMNGLTLGSLASLATEYAADNASALFTFLWQNLPNTIAAVSGGRGASAAADFAANKTIVIPTMQGYLASGVDDMGTTAAGIIQAVTTCSPPGGSNIIPVTSATNIAVGQNVIINGSSAGTVTGISGLNITISTSPALGTNVSWRSSFFTDAQQIGSNGGVQNNIMTSDQLAAHTHSITDPGHVHGLNNAVVYAGGVAAGATNTGGGATNTASATTGITATNSAGGGHPLGNIQPSRLFSWYLKL